MPRHLFLRARGVLGESARITLSQVLFSVASLLLTGAATRRLPAAMAAGLFAVYALQSTLVTSLRSYFFAAPLMRLPRRGLSREEYTYAIKTLALLAAASSPVLWVVAIWQGLGPTSAFLVAGWACVMTMADVLRSMTFIFCRSVTWTLWAGAIFALAQFVGLTLLRGSSFLQLLGPPIVITAAFAIVLANQLAKDSTSSHGHFWQQERAFARSQALESGGTASWGSISTVLIAHTSPLSAVSLQVTGQGVVTPTMLIVNGLSLPLTRRLRARQIEGRGGRALITTWAITLVSALTAATVFSVGVGSPLFSAFFGPPVWARAAQVLPYVGAFVLANMLAQVFVLPARATAPPARIRRVTLVSVGLSQSTLVAAVALWGDSGLAPGLAMGALVNVGVWVAASQYIRPRRPV